MDLTPEPLRDDLRLAALVHKLLPGREAHARRLQGVYLCVRWHLIDKESFATRLLRSSGLGYYFSITSERLEHVICTHLVPFGHVSVGTNEFGVKVYWAR